jgi:CubicO group peptidase (beta-lactamase class C family)
MCLADEGKLSDDEDVNQYLKRWQIPPSDAAPNAKITLRQLASHTAGFTVPVFGGYAKGDPVPDTLSILNGETPANSPAVRLAWPPGEMARYSGGGFTIMQLMMEDITGEPFAELMRRLVLGPTGMSRSTFSQPLPVG